MIVVAEVQILILVLDQSHAPQDHAAVLASLAAPQLSRPRKGCRSRPVPHVVRTRRSRACPRSTRWCDGHEGDAPRRLYLESHLRLAEEQKPGGLPIVSIDRGERRVPLINCLRNAHRRCVFDART